jgi:sodium transport system permease protein
MTARAVRTILFKELLDTFRDKRNLVAMIGVPLVLYPAVFVLSTQAALVEQSRTQEQVSRIGIMGPGTAALAKWLEDPKQFEIVKDPAMEGLLAGALDAVIVSNSDMQQALDTGGRAELIIRYDTAEPRSREARERVRNALEKTYDQLVAERVKNAGLSENFADPIEVKEENVAPAAKSTGSLLGTILPLLMVVMLGVGAFYPAVDLTAGEKERGTFETLLSTPATKMEIVTGKFLAVFSLSMLTGGLNLASMLATLWFQLAQIFQADGNRQMGSVVIDVPPSAALTLLAILIPLAFFISALMMTVALLARSFREAQSYVTPFFLAIILPASAALAPSVSLDRVMQFVPIANVSLLFRDILVGKANGDVAFFVFISTAVYALLALLVAAWMFQREDVVLSQASLAPITFDRRSIVPSQVPTPGIALGIFGVVMLLLFYGGFALQGWRLHEGLVLTQFGLILLPVIAALLYGKVNLRTALNLRLPSAGSLFASLLIGTSWVVISIQIGAWLARVIKTPDELNELSKKLFDVTHLPGGVWTLIAIVALSPAICEESLFRGVLLSAFRKRLPNWATVAIIGLLFGLFHMSIYKIVPTALSGALFTYLVLRSGSILCSSLAHLLLNGLAILVETGTMPDSFTNRLKDLNIEQNGLPLSWVAVATAIFIAGIISMEISARAQRSAQ